MLDQIGREIVNPLEALKGKVDSWEQLEKFLPPPLKDNQVHLKFVRKHHEAQIAIKGGKLEEAARLFKELDRTEGFRDFEENNPELLAAVDILAKGTTNIPDLIIPKLRYTISLN